MKKHIIIAFLAIAFLQNAKATTYYFSSSTGNDSNGCTVGSPCASVSKANSLTLSPGDFVLFKAGDTFTGEIIPSASGSSGNPITYGNYGTGAAPIITLAPVTGWTLSGSVWQKTINNHPGTIVFYEDGLPQLPEASSSACTDGKWYGDGTNLYYKPTSGDPTTHTITYANLGSPEPGYIPLMDLTGLSYITVNGLQFKSAGIGIKTYEVSAGTSNLIIENCNFAYCQRAIFIMPGTNNNSYMSVLNNTFTYCQCDINMYTWIAYGAHTGSTDGTNQYCTITGNYGYNTGTVDGSTWWNIGTDYEFIGLNNFMNGTIANNYTIGGHHIGLSWYNITTRESSNNTISGNTFISTGKEGCILTGDSPSGVYNYAYNNNTFKNNVFVNTDVDMLSTLLGTFAIFQGTLASSQNYIYNNTFSGNENTWIFGNSGNAPYFTVENNIIYNSGSNRWIGQWSSKPATLTVDYNLYYEDSGNTGGSGAGGFYFNFAGRSLAAMQGLGMETHSIVGSNPLFVNSSGNNFNLLVGSPAINAGLNVGLPFAGTAPDMGAFEYTPIIISGRPILWHGKLVVKWH